MESPTVQDQCLGSRTLHFLVRRRAHGGLELEKNLKDPLSTPPYLSTASQLSADSFFDFSKITTAYGNK